MMRLLGLHHAVKTYYLLRYIFVFSFSCFIATVHADSNFAYRHDVQLFIQHMVYQHGFQREQLQTLFNNVRVRRQVVRHIFKPMESEPWHLYQSLFINEAHIREGVAFWNKNTYALQQAEKIYGVPPGIIVATIGVETKYGEKIGDLRVIDSLTNIAFSYSYRAAYFRRELEEFLILTREQHLNPLTVMGSYAGAIGMPQFMPSSYREYAVSFSRHGRADLIHNQSDVIASIANYYHKHGWLYREPVAVPAVVTGRHYRYLLAYDRALTLAQLAKYGILAKRNLASSDTRVKVVQLDDRYSREYWLGFHNFEVIKRYNASDLYAMAVYQLSSYITAKRERMNNE